MKLVESDNEWFRMVAAELGRGLEKLSRDPSPVVRASVAEQGYALDRLMRDEKGSVRTAVARQGY